MHLTQDQRLSFEVSLVHQTKPKPKLQSKQTKTLIQKTKSNRSSAIFTKQDKQPLPIHDAKLHLPICSQQFNDNWIIWNVINNIILNIW